MRLAVVGGPPSVGKTQALLHALGHLRQRGLAVRAVKLDCLVAGDEAAYARRGIEALVGLSGYVCPDHFLATNIDRIAGWGQDQGADVLVIESAGLCNRCSPYLQGHLAVAVMDTLSGMGTPRKVGPLLRSADLVVLTRGDLVSQAEREVFRLQVAAVNRRARIIELNGLTGQGSLALADALERATPMAAGAELRLRYPMPAAVCSFCLGEKRLGAEFASGNVRLMSLPESPEPGREVGP
jgi:Ni2+-binding GTPase involved in maturation of urease and hydrogenase